MRNTNTYVIMIILAFAILTLVGPPCALGEQKGEVCRPVLSPVGQIDLGEEHNFNWTCSEKKRPGKGFYILFIRPSGTYALFRVDDARKSFKFKPDIAGQWRWMVINTDPDRTKPDIQSKTGLFQVLITLH